MKPAIACTWLGTVPYAQALAQQRAYRESMIRGQAPEAMWFLEHPSVITVGRRAVGDLPEPAVLAALGIQVIPTERGGLATWHGRGQLMGYTLLNLRQRGLSARDLVYIIEQGIIQWLAEVSITATRRCAYPGVWVGSDKIASVGLHVRHGMAMHGFSLNLTNYLFGFSLITPCGITDGGVTSVQRLTDHAMLPEQVWSAVAQQLVRAMG